MSYTNQIPIYLFEKQMLHIYKDNITKWSNKIKILLAWVSIFIPQNFCFFNMVGDCMGASYAANSQYFISLRCDLLYICLLTKTFELYKITIEWNPCIILFHFMH